MVLLLIGFFDTCSPIFYHERVDKNMKPFNLYKLRSMHQDTKSVVTHLANYSSVKKYDAFLRKSKLDDLQQLLNFFIGDMILLWPRPYSFNQEELIHARNSRGVHYVVPGITGLSQIIKIDISTLQLLDETEAIMTFNLTLTLYF